MLRGYFIIRGSKEIVTVVGGLILLLMARLLQSSSFISNKEYLRLLYIIDTLLDSLENYGCNAGGAMERLSSRLTCGSVEQWPAQVRATWVISTWMMLRSCVVAAV